MRERLQIVFFKNFFIQFVFTQEPIWLLIHITLENSQESTRKCVILVDALLGDLFYNFIEGLHNVTGFGNSFQEILTKFSLYLSLAVLYFYNKSSFTLFSSQG